MTEEEKIDASLYRRANPPHCHYGLSAVLVTLSQRGAFTPFYRCGLPDSVSSHAMNVFGSFYVFCTYNITLKTFDFCREGSHRVSLRSTIMDPYRTGLLSMNLQSLALHENAGA